MNYKSVENKFNFNFIKNIENDEIEDFKFISAVEKRSLYY
jgi:hypothetical protein